MSSPPAPHSDAQPPTFVSYTPKQKTKKQVYQILLDSRFQPPANQSITGGGGDGGGNVTLDIEWQFAPVRSDRRASAASAMAATTAPDACEWRVSRCREGEAEFPVKEGVGAERGLEASAGGVGGTERDGYR